jgi:hypothetical protein
MCIVQGTVSHEELLDWDSCQAGMDNLFQHNYFWAGQGWRLCSTAKEFEKILESKDNMSSS